MKNVRHNADRLRERVIFTLPKNVVAQVRRYAGIVRGGNKSGFVADAIEAYVRQLRRASHTRKLRASYAAAAEESRKVAVQWDGLSDEVWAKLEEGER